MEGVFRAGVQMEIPDLDQAIGIMGSGYIFGVRRHD